MKLSPILVTVLISSTGLATLALAARSRPDLNGGAALSAGGRKGLASSTPQLPGYHRAVSSNRLFRANLPSFRLWAGANWMPVRNEASRKFDIALNHVSGDLQAVVITEKRTVPPASLADLALENAQKSDPDSKMTSVENRFVNGRELMCLTYDSTLKAGPTTFYGYFYSGEQGTVQVIAMAPQSLFHSYLSELTDLLNGLEILALAPGDAPVLETSSGGRGKTAEIYPRLLVETDGSVSAGLSRGVPSIPTPAPGNPDRVDDQAGSAGTSAGSPVAIAVDSKPVPLHSAPPKYTEDARQGGIEGIVTLRALVGPDGAAKNMRIVYGLPLGLDEEAILAVQQIQFKPAMKDGQPVAYWVTMAVEFYMCNSAADCPQLKQQ